MTKKFSESKKILASLDDKLHAACEGLIYISEQDAAVTLFKGEAAANVDGQTIIQQTGSDANAHVEEIAFDTFFQKLTVEKDWFGETEKASARRFSELRDVLAANLTELKVFRIGKVQIDIFVVGLDKRGNLTGIRAFAVET